MSFTGHLGNVLRPIDENIELEMRIKYDGHASYRFITRL